jgi:hypothetical protein
MEKAACFDEVAGLGGELKKVGVGAKYRLILLRIPV